MNSTVPTKNTGDQLSAAELNNIVAAVNSKADLSGIVLPDGVLSGLASSIASSTLTVALGTWRIANVVYQTTVPTVITVAAADPSNNRIDLIYANATNQIQLLEGTAAPNPLKPSAPSGCIEVGFVLVTIGGNSAGSAPPAEYVTVTDFENITGDLEDLLTDNQSNLVNAINEVSQDIASISQDNVILKIFKKSNYS